MKLNAGSGPDKNPERLKGFLNLDLLRPFKGVQGDILKMPFKDSSFEEVRLIHTLEHVRRHMQVPMLGECYRVLAPGGVFYVEVPDFLENMVELVRAYRTRPLDWEPNWEHIRILTVGVFGKQRSEGDAHHWGYNEYFLRNQLSLFKWESIERAHTMVSNHFQAENVILMKCTK